MNEKKKRLLSLLCTHCSRHAGRNRYHPGPRGGGPGTMCPYDTRGVLRPGYKFVGSVYDTEISMIEVPDYRDIEMEGLKYEDDGDVKNVHNGQQLLTDAIGPFSSNE